jgi:hypothetical protein
MAARSNRASRDDGVNQILLAQDGDGLVDRDFELVDGHVGPECRDALEEFAPIAGTVECFPDRDGCATHDHGVIGATDDELIADAS